ncbi:MAG: nucleoside-diphosphate kinase [Candidatus Dojkabacteria bacterium]|nr:nucleoside-diphosphate kinase [Candidatus Dojkabacteria bacterium]
MKKANVERSFVMIKPDGIARGLIGRIFQRFEEQGLKLIAGRMITATRKQVAAHYPGKNEKWLRNLGDKTIASYDGDTNSVRIDFGTENTLEMGRIVYNKMMDYITSGPIVITVWEGNEAISRIRKLVGSTVPTFAEVGSIRGSFAFDTPALAVKSGRITFKTIIHASDSNDEAAREIANWFGDKYKPLDNYERVDYIDIF